MTDSDDDILADLPDFLSGLVKPGDTVTIQFTNLISPKEKLSGVYNFNFAAYLEGADGTCFKGDPGGNVIAVAETLERSTVTSQPSSGLKL